MENLAQPPPPSRPRSGRSSSQDLSPERPEHPLRASSVDLQSAGRSVAQTTGHLAESALSNLRKSIAAQRPFSIVPPDGRSSPQPDRELKPVSKLNLEDRLRSSFAIGEASTSTTPDARSHAPSPKPLPTLSHPLSPTSTPLPDSLVGSPLSEQELTFPPHAIPPSFAVQDDAVEEPSQRTAEKKEDLEDSSTQTETRYPEADVLLPPPPFSPELSEHSELHSADSRLLVSDTVPQDVDVRDDDVEVLKQRLRELELRCSGSLVALRCITQAIDCSI